jgi:hypothetical protein
MSKEGKLTADRVSADYALASMADMYTCRNLDISGVSSTYLVTVGGASCVDVKLLWPGYKLKMVHNQSTSSAATVIFHSENDVFDGVDAATSENTIVIGASGYTPRLPSVRYIKVSGTSDNLTVFLQKC